MNGTLTLKNPVMINGDKITEMKYDTNEIDGVLFATAEAKRKAAAGMKNLSCLLYTSPSPRDRTRSRMPSSA